MIGDRIKLLYHIYYILNNKVVSIVFETAFNFNWLKDVVEWGYKEQ